MQPVLEKQANRVRHPYAVLIVFFIVLCGIKTVYSFKMEYPIIWGDAYLYDNRAYNFATTGVPRIENYLAPCYPPLYSFFISPAYVITTDTDSSYHLILIINSLISSSVVFFAYLLSNHLTRKSFLSLNIAMLVGLTSASFNYSLYIMSENLMIPLMLLVLYFSFRFTELKLKFSILFGLSVAAALLTKTLMIVLIPAGLIYAIAIIFHNIRRKGILIKPVSNTVAAAISFLAPVVLWELFESFVQDSRAQGGELGYSTQRYVNGLTDIFTDPESFKLYVRLYINLVCYLVFATFGLGAVAVYACFKNLIHLNRRRLFYGFVVLSMLGISSISALHMLISYERDPDKYALFTRYIEPLIPPLFIIGMIFVYKIKSRISKAYPVFLVLSLLSVAFLLPDVEANVTRRPSLEMIWMFADLIPHRILFISVMSLELILILTFRFRISQSLFAAFIVLLMAYGDYTSLKRTITPIEDSLMHNHLWIDDMLSEVGSKDHPIVLDYMSLGKNKLGRRVIWSFHYEKKFDVINYMRGKEEELPQGAFYFVTLVDEARYDPIYDYDGIKIYVTEQFGK